MQNRSMLDKGSAINHYYPTSMHCNDSQTMVEKQLGVRFKCTHTHTHEHSLMDANCSRSGSLYSSIAGYGLWSVVWHRLKILHREWPTTDPFRMTYWSRLSKSFLTGMNCGG